MAELDRNVYPEMKSIITRAHLADTTTSCKRWAFRLLLLDYYVRHYATGHISVFPEAPSAHGINSHFAPQALEWLKATYATLDDSGRQAPIPLYNLFSLNMVQRDTKPRPVDQEGVIEDMLTNANAVDYTGLTFYTMCVVKHDWMRLIGQVGVVDHVFTFIVSSENGQTSNCYINSSYGAGCLRQSQMTHPLLPKDLVDFAKKIQSGDKDAADKYADMFFPNPHHRQGDSDDESGPVGTLVPREARGIVSQKPVILWMQGVNRLIDFACGSIEGQLFRFSSTRRKRQNTLGLLEVGSVRVDNDGAADEHHAASASDIVDAISAISARREDACSR